MSTAVLRNKYSVPWIREYTYCLNRKQTTTLSKALKKTFVNEPQGRKADRRYCGSPSPDVIPILKLHGSMNWLLCDGCRRVLVMAEPDPFSSDLIDRCVQGTRAHLKSCHGGHFRSAVLPPKRVKDVSAMSDLWTCAAALLAEASEVTFIGYSMPSYDEDAIELFGGCGRNARIEVLAKNIDSAMRLRYRTILGGDPIFWDEGFVEFFGPSQ